MVTRARYRVEEGRSCIDLKLRHSGHVKIPFIDRVIGRINLRVQQLDVTIETKTEDNVFVKVISQLGQPEALLIFGPGEAKLELKR